MESVFVQGKTEGNPFFDLITKVLTDPTQEDKDCHYPKPILLKLGSLESRQSSCIDFIDTNNCSAWTDVIIPIQVVQLGQIIIPAVPSEWTTMLGRRLRKLVQKSFTDSNIKIPIAGLSNV